MNKRGVGSRFEDIAEKYLRDKGCVILERNFRCRGAEIDIIAIDKNELIFAEVKYRKNAGAGYPEEAVNRQKQKKISFCADMYMTQNNISDKMAVRFDVIAIDNDEIRHYKNAFMYCARF